MGANFQVHIWFRAERASYGLVICNQILPRPAQGVTATPCEGGGRIQLQN